MGESVLSAGFAATNGELSCDGVSLESIARSVGTPAYVYSAALIREQYGRLARALAPVPHRIHYSAKANTSRGILTLLRSLGAGVDIVSGGELYRSLAAGFGGSDIVFSGVGKTERELSEALDAGVLLVNVESEGELRLLDRVAAGKGVVAPVALRVNPEVMVDTPHRYTRTGERGHKFGIPYTDALAVGRLAESLPNIRLAGLDMHIGSQVSSLDPYRDGMLKLLELLDELRSSAGARDVRYLDIGGGLAVTYEHEAPMDVEGFAEAVLPAVAESGLTLIVEPGRFLVGNAGVLLTRVLYRKRSGDTEYIITDAGMNDLLRPSHYNAYHAIAAVRPDGGRVVADVVGPVCESGDFFALGREVDDAKPGDLLVIHSSGAYGYSMASTYNSRPRPVEVLVDDGRFAVITERERYEDIVAREVDNIEWREA
ncbi:MAG TPA: diaminopimelate decarboxylase [Gemmatimonadaceae bacterium]|nr:diaminopimelate decarboxylase [Gemmatimonadaceae bacterium]